MSLGIKDEVSKRQPLTSGLVSVGGGCSRTVRRELASSPPVAALVSPRPNAKPPDVVCNAGATVQLGSGKKKNAEIIEKNCIFAKLKS